MSGFKSYKIRDGVHIPSKKYKEGWDAIFSDKPKKDNMSKKLYTSDEDRMMQDKNLTWSEPAIMSKDLKDVYVKKNERYSGQKLFNFNSDQIEVLKTALENQEKVWSKNKSNREYYDADLSRINECLRILTKED